MRTAGRSGRRCGIPTTPSTTPTRSPRRRRTADTFLGTDGGGTDVFAKLLYGFRLSVLFGLALTLISSSIGVLVGAVQGYFGGLIDLLGQRVVEIFAGLPILFVLIILASIVEPNVFWLLGILGLFSWMALVGVVRAEFLRARELRVRAGGPVVGGVEPDDSAAACAAERDGGDVDISAVHIEWVDYGVDGVGLFGVWVCRSTRRPWGGCCRRRRRIFRRRGWGFFRVCDVGDVVDVVDLYWGGGEGCVGSAEGGGEGER